MAATGITSQRITPRRSAVNANCLAAGARKILVAAAFIAAVIQAIACNGDSDGGRGHPGQLREIPAEDYEKLVDVGEIPESYAEVEAEGRSEYRREGSLSGTGDSDSFEVYANYNRVDVIFSWPEGEVDFWVKVFGEEGDELGDFDLDNGEIIQLLHGGAFTVQIYSRGGGGAWSATYEN
jgi:hypothetical protein